VRIGIDSGGTFTDFVALEEDGRLSVFKLRSKPEAPHEVILAGLGARKGDVVHGSTVATNALLERKGARTAFVTTEGFEDMLRIARQNRRELYNLTPAPERPLVEPELCFGVRERILYDGTVHQALEADDLARRLEGAESVAICLLHSYRNPRHEALLLKQLRGFGYVCASHEIAPEFREYERASTAVINAYVGPLMENYLRRLGGVSVMQSNGGFLTAKQAARHAVRTILSGPAGGAIGAAAMGRLAGHTRLIGFDMGGTSTDVSLIDGEPRETTEAYIDGLPLRVPMLDIHTVGAGGGSIARVDAGGLLRVGPESAGADPGPACYGVGGQCTVTDAQVFLGRLRSGQFLGGGMAIDESRAADAVARIARTLGLSPEAAAEGILRVANSNMERAIRAVSVERGRDPRDYALLAFGGGGGLHACELAAGLGIRTVIVPRFAEVLSALGMLMADAVEDRAAGVLGRADYDRVFRKLGAGERMADIRYAGQSYELTVPWNARSPGKPFHAEHQRVYGYSDPRRPVEIVTLRVRERRVVKKPRIAPLRRESGDSGSRRLWTGGRWRTVSLYTRAQVPEAAGPLLVLDYGTTTLVPQGWEARVDRVGNLIIEAAGRRA
jgi:N-methylhydantoinase A